MAETPTIIRRWRNAWLLRCPGCGQESWADEDQVRGRVSLDCLFCSYHETHDLSDQLAAAQTESEPNG